ncbi:bifunctional deaminase-reductase domain protein [Pirellula staleyi DSM 6068]|uniref:Bifunctional deaminase-reductase domain protein n=1 Tax=Pirellula staleyi (strain ATCC 27377 / DSM 6068 / ICPB 4128) TaxID=530564 RepID=D2R9B8_PIRSD|nr:dihydrofolate reductase family protein [Pirellula staleyi]ADB17668.1 bifunctional deaminase-reductase domain protein [Pirellula staleyi DSM 6068]
MKTQYYTASTLNGFLATTDHSLDWLMQFTVAGTSYDDFIRDVGALAMGSHTYEWVLHELGFTSDKPQQKWHYEQPTFVFTSRPLAAPPGVNVRFVSGDVRAVHDAMIEVAGTKNRWIVGGGELAGQFHDAGLLDELIIQITAVTLASGMPLLPRNIITPPLKLTSVQQYGDAFAELRYEVHKPAQAPAS